MFSCSVSSPRQMYRDAHTCLRHKLTRSLSHVAPGTLPPTQRRTHTLTHKVLTAACLSLPHARDLHQFWWPQDDCAHRRPHASRPNLPRYRREAANLSKGRGKGSSHDNKARPIFHENEVLWHSLQWPRREREGEPNEWMQSSYHVEFFCIRDAIYKKVTGGCGASGATDQDTESEGKQMFPLSCPNSHASQNSPKTSPHDPKKVLILQTSDYSLQKVVTFLKALLMSGAKVSFKTKSRLSTQCLFLKSTHS